MRLSLRSYAVGMSAVPDRTPLLDSLTALAPARKLKDSVRSGGSASVTDDCADAVTVNMRICDYAAGGTPAVVCGNVATDSSTASAAGRYQALTSASAWVDYYSGLYQRGNSLVEVKVWGSYRDKRTRAAVPLPCRATYTSIVPTPVGPIATATSSSQPCV